jgi:transposase
MVTKALRLPQISIIAAVSNRGKVLFSINKGTSTSLTFSYFIANLCQVLDKQNPEWRKSSTFLLDNASFHKSIQTRQHYQAMKVPVAFLGPYSFDMAAVEKLFSFIKNRDLNPLALRAYSR